MLLPVLGENSGHLDKDIGALAQKGIFSSDIIHSLDVVRVIGNKAVHPGEIHLFDDLDTAISLFKLTNYIVEKTLSDKRAVGGILTAIFQFANVMLFLTELTIRA